MAKWIRFEGPVPSESGKTQVWRVLPTKQSAGLPIGFVGWYGPWRKYAFMPESNTVFEKDCLRDIAAFCEEQTKAHRAKREG